MTQASTTDQELAGLEAARNRIMAKLFVMMGVSDWPKRTKLSVFAPTFTRWQDAVFQQLARGLSEDHLLEYLQKQMAKFKSFRGIPVWTIFRELERTSFAQMDRAHDATKRKKRAAEPRQPRAERPLIDRLCDEISRALPQTWTTVEFTSILRRTAEQVRVDRLTPDQARKQIKDVIERNGIRLDKAVKSWVMNVVTGRERGRSDVEEEEEV